MDGVWRSFYFLFAKRFSKGQRVARDGLLIMIAEHKLQFILLPIGAFGSFPHQKSFDLGSIRLTFGNKLSMYNPENIDGKKGGRGDSSQLIGTLCREGLFIHLLIDSMCLKIQTK